MFHMTG